MDTIGCESVTLDIIAYLSFEMDTHGHKDAKVDRNSLSSFKLTQMNMTV